MKKNLYKIFLYSVLFFTAILFSEKSFGQSTQLQQNQPAVKQEPPIVFKMVDENGNEMKFIMTWDDYRSLENRIKEYEKQKGITDRTNMVYYINYKLEIISDSRTKN